MNESYEDKAWEYAENMTRISPVGFMRKFKLNFECAKKLCNKIKLRRWLEARKFMKELEN